MESLVALARGSVFAGDYRIVEPLNAGGMGAVYVVDQISTGKQRALKLMHPGLVADPDLRRRFEQEARVGSKIDSEHVIEVQAAGVDGATGMPWLSMELLRGEDLSARMARGPMPPSEVHAVFEQLCHAIGAAHAAGIVHRDLKPENVFLATSRRAGASALLVKVLDFGIAKLSAEAGTHSTAAMGSPLWMAPEQTTRAPILPAADVWSLGLIAYHLLTGKHFWTSAEADSTLAQLLREIVLEPIPAASVRAAQTGAGAFIPPGFDPWFARCVDRAPEQRFTTATAAWGALASVLSGTSEEGPRTDPRSGAGHVDVGLAPYAPAPSAPTPVPAQTAFGAPAAHALEAHPSHAGTVLEPLARIPTPPPSRRGSGAATGGLVLGAIAVLSLVGGGAYFAMRTPSDLARIAKTVEAIDKRDALSECAALQTDLGKLPELAGWRMSPDGVAASDPKLTRVTKAAPNLHRAATKCLEHVSDGAKGDPAQAASFEQSPLFAPLSEPERRSLLDEREIASVADAVTRGPLVDQDCARLEKALARLPELNGWTAASGRAPDLSRLHRTTPGLATSAEKCLGWLDQEGKGNPSHLGGSSLLAPVSESRRQELLQRHAPKPEVTPAGDGGAESVEPGHVSAKGPSTKPGATGPSIRQGATQVNGRLPPEVIQRIVRANFGRFRLCYENGLRSNPQLKGRVSVKFVIDRSGSVATAQDAGSELPDAAVIACVVRGFGSLSFPQPEGGIVTVVYPITFAPGD